MIRNLFIFLSTLCLFSDSFSRKCVGISDGDKISVLRDKLLWNNILNYKKNQEDIFKNYMDKTPGFLPKHMTPTKFDIDDSVKLFAYALFVKQSLQNSSKSFNLLKSFSDKGIVFPIDKLKSVMTESYFFHYKFIKNGRKQLESDITDILMLPVFPYIDVLITDGNQCEIIRLIKERHKFLLNIDAISLKSIK